MYNIQVFIPLALSWLALGALYVICALAVAGIKFKKMPSTDPLFALVAAGFMIWVVHVEIWSFIASVGLLFLSGLFVFSAMVWAAISMKKAKNTDVDAGTLADH